MVMRPILFRRGFQEVSLLLIIIAVAVAWAGRGRLRTGVNYTRYEHYGRYNRRGQSKFPYQHKRTIPLYEVEHECFSRFLAHHFVNIYNRRAQVGAYVLLEVAHHRDVGVFLDVF